MVHAAAPELNLAREIKAYCTEGCFTMHASTVRSWFGFTRCVARWQTSSRRKLLGHRTTPARHYQVEPPCSLSSFLSLRPRLLPVLFRRVSSCFLVFCDLCCSSIGRNEM